MPKGVYDRTKSKPRPPMSEAHKRIVSNAHKNKKVSQKTRDKISKSCIGKTIGMLHYKWKGGKRKHASGYMRIKVKNHPFAKDGYILEHRLVMEKHLGRFLDPKERVHHINGNRLDNRLKNLLLFESNSKHTIHHHQLSSHKMRESI